MITLIKPLTPRKMKEIVIITLLVSVMFMYLTNKGKK